MKVQPPLFLVPFFGDAVGEILADAKRATAFIEGAETGVVLGSRDRAEAVPEGCTAMTIEEAIKAMGERDEVTLIANGGTADQQFPLMLAAANLPHVHVISVQRDKVTVLRAGARDDLAAIVAYSETIKTLAEQRGQKIRKLLARAELLGSGRFPIQGEPGEVLCHIRFQHPGEMVDPGITVMDWRGENAPPDPNEEINGGEFTRCSTFRLADEASVIVSEPLDGATRVYLLDPGHILKR